MKDVQIAVIDNLSFDSFGDIHMPNYKVLL
ncbi:hypothetical protein SAMN05444274_101574 [Mariniphaga anaerophila]|uniref:Uncharacterized protein n=1 Tax=Mariniphaga anaerophila TaxID=1484053 RepID=A0A1M4U4Y9_9BACT|nr:hypothetical protein SAMN05444274_101574 [Mariniphaga anaerophila]